MGAENVPEVKGYDMSRSWRLVATDGGPVTGTWWVTAPDAKRGGQQHVTPVEVTIWDEGRHYGYTLGRNDFTAFIRDGEVEPLQLSTRDHCEAFVRDNMPAVIAAVLAAAAGAEWPEGDR